MKKQLFVIVFVLIGVFSPTATFAQVTAYPPDDLEVCDDNNDGFAIFDLTVTVPIIIGGQDPVNLVVSFYETANDATNSTNPIGNPTAYINVSNPQVIYVRLEDNTNGDFDNTNFNLVVNPLPSPITPTPLEVCDVDNDGFAEFVLTDKDEEIIGGEPGVVVSYHETLLDAETGVFALTSPYVNLAPSIQYIYPRVEDFITDCFEIVELLLIVHPTPEIVAVSDLIMIDDDGDGFTVFDLTSKIAEILNGQDPVILVVTFFETQADALANVNIIVNPTSYTNTTNPQTIYARLVNIETSCFAVTEFDLVADGNLNIDDQFLNSLKLYPNPTSETINLKLNNSVEKISITIYNLLGQELSNFERPLDNGTTSIDISELNSGIYFIKIASGENSTIKKVIKN
jgi:hypothetical protein